MRARPTKNLGEELHRPRLVPMVAVSGLSGSGKTTLIAELTRRLTARGLAIGVVKHDGHSLSIDHPGKDSDVLFQAGAEVMAHDARQSLWRRRQAASNPLPDMVGRLEQTCDLVLIEGHKALALRPRIWLTGPDDSPPPEGCTVDLICTRRDDAVSLALDLIAGALAASLQIPPRVGLLIGGQSRRLGRPKQLLSDERGSWLQRLAVVAETQGCQPLLLGGGPVPTELHHLPRLPDAEDLSLGGPMRGMLSALRWAPDSAWVFLPCDAPAFHAEALSWLLAQRQPGVWAVMPRTAAASRPLPLPGYYDPRFTDILLRAPCPRACADHPKVARPVLPPALVEAWRNINTEADLIAYQRNGPSRQGR